MDVMVQLAHHAEAIGAYGIQISTPFYYPPSDDDMRSASFADDPRCDLQRRHHGLQHVLA